MFDRKNGQERKPFTKRDNKGGYKKNTNNAKEKIKETEFMKCTLEEFSRAVKYRISKGELPLQDKTLLDPKNEAMLDDFIVDWYEKIEIPRRATIGSAGHDFVCPIPVEIGMFQKFRIPTGIKAKMPFSQFIDMKPRSSMALDIFIDGTIDADFFFVKKMAGIITIQGFSITESLKINAGGKIAQGRILEYKRTLNERTNKVTETRIGGFGSTNGSK